MVDNVAMNRLLFDMFELERKGLDTDDLLGKFGDELKLIFGVDEVYAKLRDRSEGFLPIEEFAINTAKPYVDNRLSDYSAFKELVNYYNSGFKSCTILPVSVGGKPIASVTVLSKQDERFDNSTINALLISTTILGYQILGRLEHEKSVSLAKYFDAAFNSTVPQFLIDTDGRIIKANKSMLNLLNKGSKEMAGRNVKEIFETDANMLASLKEGLVIESGMVGENGREFRISSSRVSDRLMHVSFFETTDLRNLEERSRILRYSNYEALLMLDNDTCVVWASENVERVLRCQRESLLDHRLTEIVVERDRMREAIQNLGDGVYTDSIRLDMGNGVYVDAKASIYKNSLSGLSCILINNSLENYFKQIEKNFEELVSLSGDAIMFIDPLGYIKRLNKSAETILGYREQEIVGTSMAMLHSEAEDQERFTRSLAMAKQEGTLNNLFTNFKGKQGDLIPCEQSIKSIFDQSGNLTGYIVIARELATKRKNEELQLSLSEKEKREEKLKSESDLKTQFIYNISHDLKTPITSIKGYSKILYSGGEFGALNEEQKGYIKIILDESDRLIQLIQQILDVAKLSSGKMRLEVQQTNLKKLEENASIKALEELAAANGLSFSWSVDYSVPEVEVDPNRMIQVFVNLIGNAIKFTERGGITVSMYKKGRYVRVEVKDTGIGISREDQRRLFRKFYQVQRKGLTKQEGSGTGLGLSIVKEIVSLHEGRMGVNSELGKGSTFWFTLPISRKKKRQKGQEKNADQDQSAQ